jgi:thiamine-monophosphate kinase
VNLSDLGEFGFIERMRSWLPPGTAVVGIGDDAAVADVAGSRIAATADALVEGVHFRRDWSTASDVGFKSVSVNVSDLAAMGAVPRWLLLVLCAPASTGTDVLESLYGGVIEACALYGTELVGGDTVRSSELMLSVTALGEIEGDPMLRSGAKIGDVLAVTAPLGKAAAGVNLLLSSDSRGVIPEDGVACIDAHRRPVARVHDGIRLKSAGAHAAIDISDGLALDARRLSEASGVGIEIDARCVPIAPEAHAVADDRGWDALQMVLGGGEDLELLVSIPPAGPTAKELGLIEIGRIVDDGLWLTDGGERKQLDATGYDHFRR